MQKVYAGSVALTKLKHALTVSKSGKQLLVLPIDDNFLQVKDNAVYMNVNVVVRDEQDQYGQNGFISQKMSTEKYKELGEVAKDIKLPILGNIKDFTQNNSGDTAGASQELANDLPSPEETDDLPF